MLDIFTWLTDRRDVDYPPPPPEMETLGNLCFSNLRKKHSWWTSCEDGQTKQIVYLIHLNAPRQKKNVWCISKRGFSLSLVKCLCLCLIEHQWQSFPPPPPPSGPPLQPLTSIWTKCTWTFLPPVSTHDIQTYILAYSPLPFPRRLQPLAVLPQPPPVSKREQWKRSKWQPIAPLRVRVWAAAAVSASRRLVTLSRLCVLTSHKSSSIALHRQAEQREISPYKSGISFTSHNEHRA